MIKVVFLIKSKAVHWIWSHPEPIRHDSAGTLGFGQVRSRQLQIASGQVRPPGVIRGLSGGKSVRWEGCRPQQDTPSQNSTQQDLIFQHQLVNGGFSPAGCRLLLHKTIPWKDGACKAAPHRIETSCPLQSGAGKEMQCLLLPSPPACMFKLLIEY